MVKNYKTDLIKKLKLYKKEDIIFTDHAKTQARFRGLDLNEIKKNIYNPERLVYAYKQKADKKTEEKYDCYFGYSNTRAHRYVIVVNKKIIIVTVVKIKRRWQRRFEKRGRL